MTDNPDDANSALRTDDVDRRGFLSCMAWAGTGLLWTMSGGVPKSGIIGAQSPAKGELFFVQISDSHIGFSKAANADVTTTMQAAIAKINALPVQPSFLLHTGDISQLAKPSEFDTADQVLHDSRTKDVFFVPGEHDVGTDNGASYLDRYGKTSQRAGGAGGWYSFDHTGVHFIGLANVFNLKAGGLGSLGAEQLEWLEKDVKHLPSSTPIVVFAHVPLWTVYPAWGWGTDDGARALGYLRKFGSVTVLNGHIHQTMQKEEGNVTFHTALSTAFPQPRPGTAPAPGPMVVPANQLRDVLGITKVRFVSQQKHLAIVDESLSGESPARAMAEGESAARAASPKTEKGAAPALRGMVSIANFSFAPKVLQVTRGERVTWKNDDDVPHRIQSSNTAFHASSVLDTKATYSVTFTKPGQYPYFCSLHPTMTGSIIVR